ncbi:hypothetical protein BDQ17DRAFT_1543591 [Cyathus striatus]|nr:hypothetical protein BDQ17DRAFT_1543591 [Cyathus striatus]
MALTTPTLMATSILTPPFKEGVTRKSLINKLKLNDTIDWELLNSFAGVLDTNSLNTLHAHEDIKYIVEDGIMHTMTTQTNAPWVSSASARMPSSPAPAPATLPTPTPMTALQDLALISMSLTLVSIPPIPTLVAEPPGEPTLVDTLPLMVMVMVLTAFFVPPGRGQQSSKAHNTFSPALGHSYSPSRSPPPLPLRFCLAPSLATFTFASRLGLLQIVQNSQMRTIAFSSIGGIRKRPYDTVVVTVQNRGVGWVTVVPPSSPIQTVLYAPPMQISTIPSNNCDPSSRAQKTDNDINSPQGLGGIVQRGSWIAAAAVVGLVGVFAGSGEGAAGAVVSHLYALTTGLGSG